VLKCFYRSTKAQNLSGGNKRKLCVSNALIGGPDLQFFDEPSTGLDPIAKRHLWNTLQNSLTCRNSSIVLTTHSMLEAEYLCHKIGIKNKKCCFFKFNKILPKFFK
jgi:ATP-binding cassette, subfamily A (ABC1), member 3